MSDPVYLDNAATTPVHPDVLTAVCAALDGIHGNPANSSHAYGLEARASIDAARERVGALVGAPAGRVYFTSGATEANNLAIRGVARAARERGRRAIVVSAIEHRSVLCPVRELGDDGYELRIAPVTRDGLVDLDALDELLDEDVLLVCLHHSNNEVGTLQPVADVADRAHDVGAWLLCDATQSVGKVPVDVASCGIDLLSLSAHKLHGPKGVGALHVAAGVELAPQLTGGGQECGIRAGTPNVPAIVGLGVAADVASRALTAGALDHVRALREQLEARVLALDPAAWVNGAAAPRLPGIASITFPGRDGGALVASIPEVAMSRGSACSTGGARASHVLTAMGLAEDDALSTLRLSLGSTTTERDVARAGDAFERAVGVPQRSA